jgi:16S rRNA processing protein RimM
MFNFVTIMNLKDYFQLGSIVRSHGVKGDLVIYLDVDNPASYKNMKSLFIDESGELKEWKVTSCRINSNLATVHLNGIEDRNTSDLFAKKNVFLPIQTLPPLKDKQFYFHEVIGFTLSDEKAGDLGPIINVYELPQHPVLAIELNNREVLIPAVPEFIISVNREKKTVQMNLPDGLLDIYSA